MKTANIINMVATGILIALIIWLVAAEVKRMKLAKEIVNNAKPPIDPPPAP